MTLPDPLDGTSVTSEQSVRPGSNPPNSGRREIWNELDQSSIMSVEFIAAILTWGGVGWLVDRWLGTGPVIFGIGVMIGFATGLYLVWYRSGIEQEYSNGAARARPNKTREGR